MFSWQIWEALTREVQGLSSQTRDVPTACPPPAPGKLLGARRRLAPPPSMDVASCTVLEGLGSPTTCHPIYFPNLSCWRLSKTFHIFFLQDQRRICRCHFRITEAPALSVDVAGFLFAHMLGREVCRDTHETQTGPRRVL